MYIQNLLKKNRISFGCDFPEVCVCHYIGQWKENEIAVIYFHTDTQINTMSLYLFT